MDTEVFIISSTNEKKNVEMAGVKDVNDEGVSLSLQKVL